MSLESVRAWLSAHAPDLPIIETCESTATVLEAAEALCVMPGQIAKTLALRIDRKIVLLVTRGDTRLAELIAASTILLAQFKGMPVSTTHILSSGVAGAIAGNGSGVQVSTARSIALAWITTLPAAMAIAGLLYAIFLQIANALARDPYLGRSQSPWPDNSSLVEDEHHLALRWRAGELFMAQ